MNKMRRRELYNLIGELRCVNDKQDLYSCISILENIKMDEEIYYDNIPENLQYSTRAYDSEDAINSMDDALDLLNEAYDEKDSDEQSELISQAIDKIEDAAI